MIRTDYHMHTVFCDGRNTPEEMAQAAVSKGLTAIGFSGHSHTPFDESYCMSREATAAYQKTVAELKTVYQGRLRIFCGVEQDYYADMPTDPYDYVIGSVHYLKFGDAYVPVDEGNDRLIAAADAYCGGDLLTVMERYFETVADVVRKTGCDIIGHFDLPSKYFEKEAIVDVSAPRYRRAWQTAADALLQTGAVFEINSGAISRGCKTMQYPADDMLAYLGERHARAVLSSDSHRADSLCFGFEEMERKCAEYGVRLVQPAFAAATDL